MCGFAGVFSFNDQAADLHSLTEKATASLKHRGPDAKGLFSNVNYSVGHSRLKIIDTSALAAQPMQEPAGRYVLVFNGEIYNFRELKAELQQAGVKFVSKSDTEVLLNMYIKYGKACLKRLDGEFAFAIYDKQEKELFLARDRFGIKPLYYCIDADKIIFGSEIRLFREYGISREIDRDSLRTYFHLNYLPAEVTIFSNIRKQKSASGMLIKGNGQMVFEKYYSVKERNDHSGEPAKIVRELLERSVERRLISDVPLGSFLSGGIDSTIITGIASGMKKDLETFSVSFPDTKMFDESEYAEEASRHFGTSHHRIEVRNRDLMDSMQFIFQHLDEPFADSSALPVQLLCRGTAKHLKVVLSGDGADEIFAGYNKHEAEWLIRNQKTAQKLLSATGKLAGLLPSSRESKLGNSIRKLRKFSKYSGLPASERYWSLAGFPDSPKILIENSKQGEVSDLQFDHAGSMEEILLLDIALVLENDMLVKIDRMSMANSLEVRVPFLSHELISYAANLPSDLKINSSGRKLILKNAFRGFIPERILKRKKQGFEVPLLQWFRGELREMIEAEFNNKSFMEGQGLFDLKGIAGLKKRLFSPDPGDTPATVWAFLVFQNWYRNHFQN